MFLLRQDEAQRHDVKDGGYFLFRRLTQMEILEANAEATTNGKLNHAKLGDGLLVRALVGWGDIYDPVTREPVPFPGNKEHLAELVPQIPPYERNDLVLKVYSPSFTQEEEERKNSETSSNADIDSGAGTILAEMDTALSAGSH